MKINQEDIQVNIHAHKYSFGEIFHYEVKHKDYPYTVSFPIEDNFLKEDAIKTLEDMIGFKEEN